MRCRLLLPSILLATTASSVTAQNARFDLDTLRVGIGSRTRTTLGAAARTIEVLTREQLAGMPAATVHEMIARAVGVDVLARSAAQADVGIRGSSFEQILVLVDGVPVSDDQTGHFDLDLAVPLEAVERIEILRGTGSAVYGADAVGGAINIVTASGTSPSRVRVEGGTQSTLVFDGDGALAMGAAAVRVGGGYHRSDGHRDGTDYKTLLGRASLDVPAAGGNVAADIAFGARDFGAADFYGPYPSYEETRTLAAAVRWEPARERRFSVAPRVSLRRHDDDFILIRTDPSVYRNMHRNTTAGGEIVVRYAASSNVRLALGGSADRSSLDSERLGDRVETRGSLFAEMTAGDPSAIVVIAGLRADHHSTYGSFASPSIALAWRASPAFRVRASVDRAFRAPTWTERFYSDPANIGDPDLLPERFWAAEAGIAFSPVARFGIDAALFIRRADRLIDWAKPEGAPAAQPWRTRNVENATFRGMELSGTANDVIGGEWTLRATALSFSDDDGAGFTSKYALRPLTRTVSLESRFRLPVEFSLWARLSNSRRHGEDPWTLADVRIAFERRGITVYADGTNLTDADFLDVSAKRAAGRALHLGARLTR